MSKDCNCTNLIIANNDTTLFQYLWCAKCKIVHKDYDFDQRVG